MHHSWRVIDGRLRIDRRRRRRVDRVRIRIGGVRRVKSAIEPGVTITPPPAAAPAAMEPVAEAAVEPAAAEAAMKPAAGKPAMEAPMESAAAHAPMAHTTHTLGHCRRGCQGKNGG